MKTSWRWSSFSLRRAADCPVVGGLHVFGCQAETKRQKLWNVTSLKQNYSSFPCSSGFNDLTLSIIGQKLPPPDLFRISCRLWNKTLRLSLLFLMSWRYVCCFPKATIPTSAFLIIRFLFPDNRRMGSLIGNRANPHRWWCNQAKAEVSKRLRLTPALLRFNDTLALSRQRTRWFIND